MLMIGTKEEIYAYIEREIEEGGMWSLKVFELRKSKLGVKKYIVSDSFETDETFRKVFEVSLNTLSTTTSLPPLQEFRNELNDFITYAKKFKKKCNWSEYRKYDEKGYKIIIEDINTITKCIKKESLKSLLGVL